MISRGRRFCKAESIIILPFTMSLHFSFIKEIVKYLQSYFPFFIWCRMTFLSLPSFMKAPVWIDRPSVLAQPAQYRTIVVDSARIVKSWKKSLYSFEWLSPDGTFKSPDALSEAERHKRAHVEEALKHGRAMEKPILGIGMMDNVEIGAGRAEFLTLACYGVRDIPVHILASHESAFQKHLFSV